MNADSLEARWQMDAGVLVTGFVAYINDRKISTDV